MAAQHREIEKMRESFSRDLNKLREMAERAEERLRATEKHALLEIDRERTDVTRLQKELDAATRRAEQSDARHRSELQATQMQLADARHQAGVLEGSLGAVREASATYARELWLLRQQMTAASPRSTGRKGAPATIPARKPPGSARKVSAKKAG
jgi:chromosome segregation ATPase